MDSTPRDVPFLWGWKDGLIDDRDAPSLMECGTYEISVVSQSGSTSFGVPPYYLVAWKADGVPTVSHIGLDRSSLSWQVNQASSTLVLMVVDSRGMDGGIDPYIYTITDSNTTTNCLPTSPSTSITLAASVSTSESLETTGFDDGTNMTLNGNDDILAWPNQTGPNKQLLVSISDATGVWAKSTRSTIRLATTSTIAILALPLSPQTLPIPISNRISRCRNQTKATLVTPILLPNYALHCNHHHAHCHHRHSRTSILLPSNLDLRYCPTHG
ncbi:hypothetical protein ACEPAI_1406 [Sanghuangporus weigelae]